MDFFTTPGRRRTNSVWSHTEAQLSLGKLAQIFYLVKGPKCIMSSLIPNGQLQCSLQSWSRCASCHALCFACIFKWLFKQRINWKKYLSKVRVWESPRVIKLFYTFFFSYSANIAFHLLSESRCVFSCMYLKNRLVWLAWHFCTNVTKFRGICAQ